MLIGLTGYKGSGKDTAALGFIENGFTRLAFADKIKEVIMDLFDITHDELVDPVLKEIPLSRWPYKSPRVIMQELGEGLKIVAPDLWVRRIEKRFLELRRANQDVIITDVRLPIEYDMIKKHGGEIYRVEREGQENRDDHVSEKYIKDFEVDHVILNNFTDAEGLIAHTKDICALLRL